MYPCVLCKLRVLCINLVQRRVERNVNVKKRQVESIKMCFERSQRIKSSKYNLYEYLNRKSLII